MNRSYHKAACPICRSRGNDTRGDNLAVYQDGHSYCYACGYFIPAKPTVELVKSQLTKSAIKAYESKCDDLPIDITSDLDLVCKTWLMKYNFTIAEMGNFWWSPSKQQLIFPVFSDEGLLLFWQARNFNAKAKNKYFTSGSLYEELLLLGSTEDSSHIILVEDIVSAIILARDRLAIPLFGSTVSKDNIIFLRDQLMSAFITNVTIWLDADKTQEAILIANQAKEMGIDMNVVTSAHDPKCYSYKEIYQFLNKQTEKN